ncbi:MAG: amino acid ABC transporter permease [Chloroflexi bacterium]|nr:amino acid ABC transporter permease [Chloroflexota bacterium]
MEFILRELFDPLVWQNSIIGYLRVFETGLLNTLTISAQSLVLAFVIGILVGVMRVSKGCLVNGIARAYVEAIRNTPLLVQLIIFYFGLGPLFGNNQTIPLVLGLGLFTGAYVAEIVRAGIQSVARGQMEAALSVGMTNTQAMSLIILPQAVRRILPALAGQFISLIKDSSLVSVFGFAELTHAASRVTAATFRALVPNVFVAIVYFVIAYTLSQGVSMIERRTARSGQV